jgi:hypothetical protein
MTTNAEYARGYRAGRRKRSKEATAREDHAFWQRAFLAALPACIKVQGWQDGKGESITTRDQRALLAAGFADEAMRHHLQRKP